jgi:ABC-type dipeptide/oligopeptide/nickel transport system permease component
VAQYIFRRILTSLPVLLGIVFLVFLLARVIPGNPCVDALGERATAVQVQQCQIRFGLDKPIPEQFVGYLTQVAGGNLGVSFKTHQPVADMIVQRLPTTVELSFYALVFAILVGIPLGIVAAYKRNSRADAGSMVIANLGISTPVFVLGLVMAFTSAVILKGTVFALPPGGRLSPGVVVEPLDQVWGIFHGASGPVEAVLTFLSGIYTFSALVTFQWGPLLDSFRHLILPAVALGTIPMAIIARITRSSLLDVMGRDYIRTARAKGLSGWLVLARHALPNALLPLVTIIGLQIGLLLSGAVLTETVFNLAGMGKTLVDAIGSRDYQVVQGFVLVIAVIFMIVNLIVDISYAYIDPRVRLR